MQDAIKLIYSWKPEKTNQSKNKLMQRCNSDVEAAARQCHHKRADKRKRFDNFMRVE